MKKLVLIDGSGFIFRAFYALPAMSRSDGTPTNAVFGFTRMLIATLDRIQNESGGKTAVAVVFDSSRKSFRTEIYPKYKANRKQPPEELVPQFALIKKLPEAFNLPSLEQQGFEADDIIATLATQAQCEVTIVSSDKDLMQLVSERVTMRDPMKFKDITPQAVEEKFGVAPNKVAELQALAGDASDNIPGVPSIGEKTAALLLNEFGSLEELLKNTQKIPQQKRREVLESHKQDARLSLKLATLRTDVPMPQDIWEQLAFKPLSTEKLVAYLAELEFPKIISEVEGKFGASQNGAGQNGTSLNLLGMPTSTVATHKVLQAAEKQGEIGITDGEEGKLEICWLGGTAVLDKKADRKLIAELFASSVNKIAFDVKPFIKEFKGLTEFKGFAMPYQDLSLMAHLCGIAVANFAELQSHFSAKDSQAPRTIYRYLLAELVKGGLVSIYQTVELPLVQVLAEMEQAGIAVEAATLKKLEAQFSVQLETLQKAIFKQCGQSFNIASPKQLASVLFSQMGLPHPGKKVKSGGFSTSARVLKDLALQGHSVVADILEWRHFAKLKNTYAEGLAKSISPEDNRIHTTFLQTATNTGRLSSQNPNLQNIPIRDEHGRALRKAFTPSPKMVLIAADYSQIELRILAWLAKVKPLQQAFSEGADIHATTAMRLFGVKEVTREHRRRAKAINFGIIYGMGARALAADLKIPQAEAKKWIDAFFHHYPQIADYMESAKKACHRDGFVRTPLGRVCRFPQVRSKRAELVAFAERAAINAPIQGAAAELIKRAMVRFSARMNCLDLPTATPTKLLLQIHDELLIEAPKAQAEQIAAELCEAMVAANLPDLDLTPPLKVDCGIGNHWDAIAKKTYSPASTSPIPTKSPTAQPTR